MARHLIKQNRSSHPNVDVGRKLTRKDWLCRLKFGACTFPIQICADSRFAENDEMTKRIDTQGVESLPTFTEEARRRWMGIPADIRQRLLANVWCVHCRNEVTITNFSGTMKGRDLLLQGQCIQCKKDVARVIEGS